MLILISSRGKGTAHGTNGVSNSALPSPRPAPYRLRYPGSLALKYVVDVPGATPPATRSSALSIACCSVRNPLV